MQAADRPPKTGPQPDTGPQAVALTVEERLERLERKLAVRSAALGVAVVLALAASIVGVVLALGAKDESATKGEVRSLQSQLESVQREAAEAAEDDVASLGERLDALESRVSTIAGGQRTTESELSVVQDDIEDLRDQITDLENAPPADAASTGDGSDNP